MTLFTLATSAPLMASSSESSIIHTPRAWSAASFDPSSEISSVNHGAAMVRTAVDFRAPCGPSKIKQQSALHPGRKIRAMAAINQRFPTALV
jgi:hypothetical protein